MKKQKFCYAAVAACVGLCSLGSCSQEEMAYQGEQKDISKLKVMTRTDDESSKPEEGKIYIFNQNNVCIDTISPSALRDNTPTRIKPGTVKLIAIGSNDLSAYKVEALIDEHYIDRVRQGLTATFSRGDKTFQLVVRKVYPEVRDGKFRCDFVFKGERPENIRTGQTYYIDLELGQPEQAVIVPRGTFFQSTGGQWIFVLDKGGAKAYRRQIRVGRQNPQFYEILEGLEPGERVVTSGYEAFKDNEVLVIK